MSSLQDSCGALCEAVVKAGEAGGKCIPIGQNSKSVLNAVAAENLLSTKELQGITGYAPSEFVVKAAAGTRVSELEKLLAAQDQILGFEAPFSEDATLGGAVASGLAGPARASRGGVRDFVLGVEIVNGRGEALSFGGQVIKNVAGYDVSRLFAGSWGTLGVIADVSLRVLPKPECETTLGLECGIEDALGRMNRLARSALPLSGSAFCDGVLYIRLSGFEATVRAVQGQIGGVQVGQGRAFWKSLVDFSHAFFSQAAPIFRISVPPATPHFCGQSEWLFDWGGALRWVAGCESGLQEWVNTHRGVMLSWPVERERWIHAGDSSIDRLQAKIRNAFDPKGVFS